MEKILSKCEEEKIGAQIIFAQNELPRNFSWNCDPYKSSEQIIFQSKWTHVMNIE